MIRESPQDKLARRAATKDNSRKKKAQAKGSNGTSRAKPKVAPGRKKTHFGPVMPKKMQILLKTRQDVYRQFKHFSKLIGVGFALDQWLLKVLSILRSYPDGFPETIDDMLTAIEYETGLLREYLEESA